jgi:hypothetical protein
VSTELCHIKIFIDNIFKSNTGSSKIKCGFVAIELIPRGIALVVCTESAFIKVV